MPGLTVEKKGNSIKKLSACLASGEVVVGEIEVTTGTIITDLETNGMMANITTNDEEATTGGITNRGRQHGPEEKDGEILTGTMKINHVD